MKIFIPLTVVLLSLFTGCADQYYRVKEGAVHIYIKNDARVIYFASSLDGFKLRKAKKIDKNTWEVRAPAYIAFRYFFMADGVIYLPPCRFKEYDDFGSENCIYVPGM